MSATTMLEEVYREVKAQGSEMGRSVLVHSREKPRGKRRFSSSVLEDGTKQESVPMRNLPYYLIFLKKEFHASFCQALLLPL